MGSLPDTLRAQIAPAYIRKTAIDVESVTVALGIKPPIEFCEFYSSYSGPFGSSKSGFELLDLYEQSPNIIETTIACRDAHKFPLDCLVLTELFGGSALVLDCSKGVVYNIDFEGGLDLFLKGELKPTWKNFLAFLIYFFST